MSLHASLLAEAGLVAAVSVGVVVAKKRRLSDGTAVPTAVAVNQAPPVNNQALAPAPGGNSAVANAHGVPVVLQVPVVNRRVMTFDIDSAVHVCKFRKRSTMVTVQDFTRAVESWV